MTPEFFIFTAASPDQAKYQGPEDGVIGYFTADGDPRPLITSRADTAEAMKDYARQWSEERGIQVRLIRFSHKEIVWSTHS